MNAVPYEISKAAERDILAIYISGIQNFGHKQAKAYHHKIEKTFEFLSEYPLAARERHELTPPLRIHPYGAHIILYKMIEGGILIVRVRHAHEDWLPLSLEN